MERTWLLIFSSLGINAVFLILAAERLGWPTFKEFALHSATASWIQAIGSIGAIAAAAWVVRHQHLLELERRRVERVSSEVDSINGALLILFRQLNALLVYRKQIFEPERGNPARHLSLPATLPMDFAHWMVDWPRLAFLLQTPGREPLLQAIYAHDGFHSTVQAVNERMHFHRTEFQPRMEASAIDFSQGDVPASDVAAAAGPRVTYTLRVATDSLYENVDAAIRLLALAGDAVPKALSELYKGYPIIRFSPPPASKTATSSGA